MQVNNVQNVSNPSSTRPSHIINNESTSFKEVLNNASLLSDSNESVQRVSFDLSYENIKGMTDEEVEIYFPYELEDINKYVKKTSENIEGLSEEEINKYFPQTDEDKIKYANEGPKYIPYTPEEKRENIRFMRDMAVGFSDSDAVNKAIFEESKYTVGKAKLVVKDKLDDGVYVNPNGFSKISQEESSKFLFSINLFRQKMDFGLEDSGMSAALTDTGSIGFTDPNPTKTWKLNGPGEAISDYGYHNIQEGSSYAIKRKLASGEISLDPGKPLDPENTKIYFNERLSDKQAVDLLNTMLESSENKLTRAIRSKDEDAIRNAKSEVSKYTRMFETYTNEINKLEDSENIALLNQYTRNNKANPLENKIE